MKGGSLASDAVVNAVNPKAFDTLGKYFTNTFETPALKGGSLASDSVVKGIDVKAFNNMNANFTNVVKSGGKKAKAATTAKKSPSSKKACTKGKKTGGRCPICGSQQKGGGVPSLDSLLSNATQILSGNPTQTSETFASRSYLPFHDEPGLVPQTHVMKLLSPAPAPAPVLAPAAVSTSSLMTPTAPTTSPSPVLSLATSPSMPPCTDFKRWIWTSIEEHQRHEENWV